MGGAIFFIFGEYKKNCGPNFIFEINKKFGSNFGGWSILFYFGVQKKLGPIFLYFVGSKKSRSIFLGGGPKKIGVQFFGGPIFLIYLWGIQKHFGVPFFGSPIFILGVQFFISFGPKNFGVQLLFFYF